MRNCLAVAAVALAPLFSFAEEKPLPAKEAAKTAIVPSGFNVTLFAAEPDVRQPIGFAIDDRGRLWVAEAYNYPDRNAAPRDRIVILEDSDGDGKCDRRTVFYDKLNYVTGIEVGFGGVWVMTPPRMLFIPDKNRDNKPDGAPKVLLDGFGVKQSAHNIANGFTWGPDGWLYAGHGRTTPSDVGKPGTPKDKRIHFDGGVFRYHPTGHVFEPFCDGTTNPWGVDFDDYGQAFISNCVNPHLFHAIQGGHYEPWRGRKSSRFAYERLPTIADHVHWKDSPRANPKKDRGHIPTKSVAAGGHAHCGMLVYLGDNWPAKYRNTAFFCNVHGRSINNDTLDREGSGYSAKHRPDLFKAKDQWFKGVTLRTGPDGSVFVTDWSDTGECHDYKNTHRETGRIFKISFGTPKWPKVDIASLPAEKLVQLHLHKNDWYVRHARRVLQERHHAGKNLATASDSLRKILNSHSDITRRLRALWTLHAIGGLRGSELAGLHEDKNEYLRAWAIRLASEPPRIARVFISQWQKMAETESSPFVRLHLASATQRLPLKHRWPILKHLVKREADAKDRFLPLMYWYALQPVVGADPRKAAVYLKEVKIPKLRQFLARRIADAGSK